MDETLQDLAVFGATPEQIEAHRAATVPKQESFYEVFPENWPIVETFLRVQNQWIYAPMGGATGLNYLAVDFAFKLYRTKNQKRVFEGLRIVESEALRLMNEPVKTDPGKDQNGAKLQSRD